MLDLKFIRDNIDLVRQAIEKRQDTAPLDEILHLDLERRQRILELESLRHERKEAARERKTDQETVEEGRDLRAMQLRQPVRRHRSQRIVERFLGHL